jgi:hypothetical protein
MASKKFAVKSIDFPFAAAKTLADMLTGKAKFDKWKAITAGMQIMTYLASYASDLYGVKAIKASRISKKEVGETLDKIVSNKGKIAAASFEIPVWLMPILVKLVLKWIESSYPSKED